jgi:hypothetical protein
MTSLKRAIALTLAFMMSSQAAFAGPVSDAKTYVANSQEAAREIARSLFHQYLMSSAINAQNAVEYSNGVAETTLAIQTEIENLEALRKKLALAEADALDASEETGFDEVASRFATARKAFEKIYSDAKASQGFRDYLILNGLNQAASLQLAYSGFLSNIENTCRSGIAASIGYPELPPIRPIVPTYSFGVSFKTDGNGNTSVQPEMPQVDTEKINGDVSQAVIATAMATGYTVGAYLVTGKVILSSAAAANMTAAQTMAASGVGLAAAAAVAVIMYMDGLLDAIKKSREVSDAMWIVFNEKADAETVKSEFRTLCNPLMKKIPEIKTLVARLNENDPAAKVQLVQMGASVEPILAEISRLQSLYSDEIKKITDDLTAQPNSDQWTAEQRKTWVTERVNKSPAAINFQKYVAGLDENFVNTMMEYNLVQMGAHATEVEQTMQANSKDLFKKQVETKLERLLDLAALNRKMAVPKNIKVAIAAEIKANKVIADLYRSFDTLFATFVTEQLTSSITTEPRQQLREWLKNVRQTQVSLPASQTLKILEKRGTDLLKFLNIEV